MKQPYRRYIPPTLCAVTIPAVSMGLTAWILRHLGFLVSLFAESGEGDKFDFAEIFRQTLDADLTIHPWIPLLCGVLFWGAALGASVTIKGRVLRGGLCAAVWLLLFVTALIVCLALTRVNDIRFCHLLGKLIPLMDKL